MKIGLIKILKKQLMEVNKIKDHLVNSTYSYLFDTNVWLYIYGPVAGSRPDKQKIYSNLLNDILSRKATIYITSLNISEYINVVLNIGFRQWKRSNDYANADFKRDYRSTDDYKAQLEDAIFQVQEILKVAEKRPDDFNAINIDDVLQQMSKNADYNDSYMLKSCEYGGMKLVSDDGDFKAIDSRVILLTA